MPRGGWNDRIITEFRANNGKVGGQFEGIPLLLLHHTGARTGIERVNPLAYRSLDDGAWAIFASKGGAPSNPDWYHNLLANPYASVERGGETIEVRARVAEGDERERIWDEQKKDMPGFGDYEKKTKRQIPVVILERIPVRLPRRTRSIG
jgi:deazaflavin-dependent oxidoreductase (nitroreductase family)